MNSPPQTDPRPIGVFDSGVGGLTVLRALCERFPNENFIYLGDTARVPYGTKSSRTVERYTLQVSDFLLERGVKALVAACNTASALGLGALRAQVEIPVVGVIQPGAQTALDAMGKNKRIGVIGTRSTIASGAYPQAINLLDPAARVTQLPCPLFVPLVEEGWSERPTARLIIEESLEPLLADPPEALILGCTHYPVLKEQIGAVMGPDVALVDSAEAVADALAQRLGDIIPPAPQNETRRLEYLVTDVADRFQEVAKRFLNDLPVSHVEMIDL